MGFTCFQARAICCGAAWSPASLAVAPIVPLWLAFGTVVMRLVRSIILLGRAHVGLLFIPFLRGLCWRCPLGGVGL